MGADERAHEKELRVGLAAQDERYERIAGPIRDFASYPDGCPACGGTNATCSFCDGIIRAKEHIARRCGYGDRAHLHLECQCGRPWVTRTLDDPENAHSVYGKVHRLIEAMKCELIGRPDGIMFDKVDLERVKLARLQVLDIPDDPGSFRMVMLAPEGPPSG